MTKGKLRSISNEREEIGGYDSEVDGAYNPADFIIPASDHQGHSERAFCRLQPQHHRAMQMMARAKRFPFRTDGDLMRWAIVRGIRVLERIGDMPGFLGAADAITEILREDLYMQEFTSMFGTMERVINNHIAAGANGEARKLLTKVLSRVRSIEEEHWRKRCEEEVMKRFKHLLEVDGPGRGRARIRPGEEDGE